MMTSFDCSTSINIVNRQTNNIKNRIYSHINSIKIFKPYENFKCVGNHFNLRGHNLRTHFTFFIFKDNIDLLEDRLYIDTILLNLFKSLNVKLINDYIPNLKDYYQK